MSEETPKAPSNNELVADCGCCRAFVKRMAPALNADGTAKFENGAFVMEEVEEIEESYCPEHASSLIERQAEVQKALAGGASYEETSRLLLGVSPFPQLEAPESEES